MPRCVPRAGTDAAPFHRLRSLSPSSGGGTVAADSSSVPCPQTVFAIVSFGAIVLTVNVVLLGGNIGFFQVHSVQL